MALNTETRSAAAGSKNALRTFTPPWVVSSRSRELVNQVVFAAEDTDTMGARVPSGNMMRLRASSLVSGTLVVT